MLKITLFFEKNVIHNHWFLFFVTFLHIFYNLLTQNERAAVFHLGSKREIYCPPYSRMEWEVMGFDESAHICVSADGSDWANLEYEVTKNTHGAQTQLCAP